ncbi:hypothetical protein NP493_1340g01044 [Ridgeia piscesae]|uniref:Uncharacterized protein n=1 Tax=Ridgeia piscesae TaxID=27915 RepID=A0AAD9K7Q9_RIDPI|nr:hypothetical protein NP493_1340g01044 [Ridgeia piscesae]
MHSSTMKLKASELEHSDPAAQQTVAQIQQLETTVIDISDKVFLENERKTWKQVLATQQLDLQQQSSDIQQVTV